jgi:hypothetical protein
MPQRLIQLTKDATIPISIGLLAAMVLGVWTLAVRVTQWENKLDRIEHAISDRWTYGMAREAWGDLRAMNPDLKTPDITRIRNEHLNASK